MIAADDLRGQRIVNQAQVLADVLLDERLDGAVGADGTGDGTEGNVLASVLKTIEIALELPAQEPNFIPKSSARHGCREYGRRRAYCALRKRGACRSRRAS